MAQWYPLFVLGVGLAIVLGGIVVCRVHAFLALIVAALVVSLLAPGDWNEKVDRVGIAFGTTAANIGIVIAAAAIVGQAMTASGAADRIVAMFLRLLGAKRGAPALMASGFTLAVPVFFDTVFYLLVPLARSMYRRTGGNYLKYLLALVCSATAHALVPPTPGPLLMANQLGVDVGLMMLVGVAVGLPGSIAGLFYARWADAHIQLEKLPPIDEVAGDDDRDPATPTVAELPGLALSLAPIVLPVALITLKTISAALQQSIVAGNELGAVSSLLHRVGGSSTVNVLGNPSVALLLSAALALLTWRQHKRPRRGEMAKGIESAVMSAGVIILITAAGGAFGAMLREAQLAEAIQHVFGDSATGGLGLLMLGFAMATLIKFAQGSSTTAMIVTSGMFAAMIDPASLGYHPVYLATAIGSGALVGSWMNDSGFWIFTEMGGLTELEALKTWTPTMAILGVVSFLMTVVGAVVVPLAG